MTPQLFYKTFKFYSLKPYFKIPRKAELSYINKKQMLLNASKIIAAGLATISLIGAGVGIGNVFGSFLVALSRNPLLLKTLFTYAILGFALVEAIALFGLMMSFLLLFGL